MSIKSEVERLQRVIQKAQTQIEKLRQGCPHTGATREHKSNTGNYDPSADCYWTEFRCPECGLFWRVEGSR